MSGSNGNCCCWCVGKMFGNGGIVWCDSGY